jgi:hypothetical protein
MESTAHAIILGLIGLFPMLIFLFGVFYSRDKDTRNFFKGVAILISALLTLFLVAVIAKEIYEAVPGAITSLLSFIYLSTRRSD